MPPAGLPRSSSSVSVAVEAVTIQDKIFTHVKRYGKLKRSRRQPFNAGATPD